MSAPLSVDRHPSITCWDEIPKEAPKAVAQSFLCSLSFGVIWSGGSLAWGLWKGTAGVVATLIDAFIRPLLNQIFPDEVRETSYEYWLLKLVVVYTAMTVITPWIAPLFCLTSSIQWSALPLEILSFMVWRSVCAKFGWPPNPNTDAQFYLL